MSSNAPDQRQTAQRIVAIAHVLEASAEEHDRSTDPTVVEYAVQELFKGKSPAAAAKHTAKKLSGGRNIFLGPGTSIIDPAKLEAALWDRLAEKVKKAMGAFKTGAKHFAPESALDFYHQKPGLRKRLDIELRKRGVVVPAASDVSSDV